MKIFGAWFCPERCLFEGLVVSQRYLPTQQLEIYNFRVVPEVQISKTVDFVMLYIIFVY